MDGGRETQGRDGCLYIHRRKGTVAAIRRVIEAMGFSMSIAEWWEVADPRGTFRLTIDVNDVGITDEIVRSWSD